MMVNYNVLLAIIHDNSTIFLITESKSNMALQPLHIGGWKMILKLSV